MPQYTGPLPRPRYRADTKSAWLGTAIAWTVLLGVAFSPRLGILGLWIFGDWLGDAFGSWIIPALGFILLPWTTLAYAVTWGVGSDVVSSWEWIVVSGSFLVDVLLWLWVRSSVRK